MSTVKVYGEESDIAYLTNPYNVEDGIRLMISREDSE